jgi:hypothetical protein
VLWLNADVRFILNQGSPPQAAVLLRAGNLISTTASLDEYFSEIEQFMRRVTIFLAFTN